MSAFQKQNQQNTGIDSFGPWGQEGAANFHYQRSPPGTETPDNFQKGIP